MNRQQAIDWIKAQTPETEFAISFYKADGSLRLMKVKYGFDDGARVKNPLKVGKAPPAGQITVYDVDKKDYRAFKIDSLVAIDKGNGWEKIE